MTRCQFLFQSLRDPERLFSVLELYYLFLDYPHYRDGVKGRVFHLEPFVRGAIERQGTQSCQQHVAPQFCPVLSSDFFRS